jgi:hypothetical protein
MVVKTVRFRSTRFLAAVIVAICAAVSVVAWSLSSHLAQRQERERVIEKAFTRNEVVEFTEIKVSQNGVTPGKAFDADDEWLNKGFVKVKNISDKPIVYLSVSFNFPETKETGPVMSYRVVFGQSPGSKFPQKHDPIFMLPGDTLEIPLDKHYTDLKSFIERRHRIRDIHKLELEIGFVIFADKTCWAAGNFCRQDPNDPDHFINTGDRPEPNQ